MKCAFLEHGIRIYYTGTVTPCCVLQYDHANTAQFHIDKLDLNRYHQSAFVTNLRQQLHKDQWPKECSNCESIENQGRQDSMRLNGNQAYGDFASNSIALEIRPGNTCNFACQTCWPAASSRVHDFYKRAQIPVAAVPHQSWDYQSLLPILSRIRSIVILGGEPFYDKKTLQFLRWASKQPIDAHFTIFTNGSLIDHDMLRTFDKPLTLVFSIDAIGRPAEYIRYGTNWTEVEKNYWAARQIDSIDTRVNITTSVYNFAYIKDLVQWLGRDWPSCVTFGTSDSSANSWFMNARAIPLDKRTSITQSLNECLSFLGQAAISSDQKNNAINAVRALIQEIEQQDFDATQHQTLIDFIKKMDSVKNICIDNYCPEVSAYLVANDHRL